MSMATVTLGGDALLGVDSHLMAASLMEPLPTTVCLGRVRPAGRPQCLSLGAFFDPVRLEMGALPPSTNRREKAAAPLGRMYLNDRYGDCVIAGKAHALGLWSANDADHGGPAVVQATDQEIYAQYQSVCGPGDRGCVIPHVLDYVQSQGFVAGGYRYTIDGYVSVDWRNQDLVKVAVYAFGALSIGINLPQAWTQQAVWDVTNSRIVGGHDVTVVDFGPDGVYVSSWGRVYLITWRAFTSTRWLEECYALLAPLWYGNDRLAPCGIDVAGLRDMLAKIGQGQVPPLPDPTPPVPPTPPPVPPVPPTPSATITLTLDTTRKVVTIPAGWMPEVAK